MDQKLLNLEKKVGSRNDSRLMMELHYARHISATEEGKYDELVTSALDFANGWMNEKRGTVEELTAKVEEMLAPMVEDCKKYTWIRVGHAHIDMNWMWDYKETSAIVLDTFRTMLNLMKAHPEFVFAQSQASTYRIVEDLEPEMLDEIRAAIKRGQWEVTACNWVEPDRNTPALESQVRHPLYAKRYLSKLLDIPMDSITVDFEPDAFGHNASIPNVMPEAGVKYLYHTRAEIQNGLYRWQGESGNEIIAYRDAGGYNGSGYSFDNLVRIPHFCKKLHMPCMLSPFGAGDHGGGPTNRDLYRIEDCMTWPIFPTVKFGTYAEFFAAAEANKEYLPVLTGERNFIFTGCYTTQNRIKRGNAISERLLNKGEMFNAFAHTEAGVNYYREKAEESWRKVLFNQFHDILTGSGVRDTREYAMGAYQQAQAQANAMRRSAYNGIGNAIDTSNIHTYIPEDSEGVGAGVGFGCGDGGCVGAVGDYRLAAVSRGAGNTRIFHVFNNLPYDREEVTEVVVWDYREDFDSMQFTDINGNELECQPVDGGHNWYWMHDYVRVLVKVKVPACGYTTIVLRNKDAKGFADPMACWNNGLLHEPFKMELENDLVRVEFDPVSARVKKIINKKTGENTICDAGFDFITEQNEGMSSWIVGRYMTVTPIETNVKVERNTMGEVRKCYKVSTKVGNGTEIEYFVHLDKGSDKLVFTTNVDWREIGNHRETKQLSFSVKLPEAAENFTYRIPAGERDRVGEALDKPSLGGIACQGVTLMCDSRSGFRGDGDVMRVTLIRGSNDPDKIPEFGDNRFCVAVGLLGNKSLTQSIENFAQPFDVISGTTHEGKLPQERSFLTLESGDVEINAVKMAEESEDIIVHINNRLAEKQTAVLVMDATSVETVNLLEEPVENIARIEGGKIYVELGSKRICGLKIRK